MYDSFRKIFDKFSDYHSSTVGLNNIKSLIVHSLGNYLLQSFVSGLGYEHQVRFLNNILLHQADVDSVNHDKWADFLTNNCRVLATINETDDILDYSDIINPDRLGNTLENLNSNIIKYFNFGRIPDANDEHRLWISPTINNDNANTFFASVFTGKKVKTGHLEFDSKRNCFHVE
ncbi:alpha/beta hydrolase [Shewanella psychropiezotolerans]|uniref:Alpha/beta hydrolase n=1 Tax=Shewanella psychropiezotolerans TaxID=2593655 RepID=A0ABX5WZG0_9GAMM|nr:alpha/beta hydrolase [Shewanella psychropiezotolerans]